MADHDPYAPLRTERPGDALGARVRGELRSRGLLRSRPRGAIHTMALAAAAALLFLSGAWVGSRVDASRPPAATGNSTAAPSPQFALLLYEPAGFDTTRSHTELAREYGAWAASLGARFVGGEALGEQRLVMPAPSSDRASSGAEGGVGAAQPTGYFLIRAENWEAAMALAAECPHVRHGGVVAVRAITT
jgi:hypothetical protein